MQKYPPALARKSLAILFAGFASGFIAAPSVAGGLVPQGAFVETGAADHGIYATSVGLIWSWSLRYRWLGGEVTASTEAFASHWSAKARTGREGYTELGLVPLARYRFSEGRSPWFVEGGIGVSLLDSELRTPYKQLSTTFNFYDVVAAGRNFGADMRHEISLRMTHMSNGGIKKPNPGENFFQLRYAASF